MKVASLRSAVSALSRRPLVRSRTARRPGGRLRAAGVCELVVEVVRFLPGRQGWIVLVREWEQQPETEADQRKRSAMR